MKSYKFFIKALCLSSTLFYGKYIIADETYVLCADKDKNWKWLDNENYKVQGTWSFKFTEFKNYYNYFILEEGMVKYNSLKSQCIKEFGTDFPFPQPSDSFFSKWAPFSIDTNEILPGHITYFPEDFYLRVNEKLNNTLVNNS